MLNEMTMNVKMKRIKLCDLMLACTVLAESSGNEKWEKLHDELKQQLEEFDKKHGF